VASVVDHLKVTDDPLTACDAIRVYDEMHDNAIDAFTHHVGRGVRVLYRSERGSEPGWTGPGCCCVTAKREAQPERGSEDGDGDR
jgi:hypothetical protein